MKWIAILPDDRNQQGTLEVWIDGGKSAEFPCLGKADDNMARQKGNPKRDRLRPFGDTPLGTWTVRVGVRRREIDTYGPAMVLMLWPTGGEAMKAYASPNRRNGIWIHGGLLNAAGGLRPTYGCLRVSNTTMVELHKFIARFGSPENLEIKEVSNV